MADMLLTAGTGITVTENIPGLTVTISVTAATYAAVTHATTHQNGGADEISVAGLSGLLADAQTPLAHVHAAADITSGIISSVYGGTGNGFTKFSGPAAAEKTFTLPNATCNILTDNALVTVGQGGTGANTLTGVVIGAGAAALTAVAILTSVNGGTGNGFTKFSGPAAAEKTFTLPNASATILTDNAAVSILQGGTGQTTATNAFDALAPTTTAGDLIQHNGTDNIRLASVATGNALISGGVGTVSSWGKIGLTTHISGILAGANGGTNNGFMDFTGPTTALKTFTLPDATCTILTTNAVVSIAQGGTGQSNATAAFDALAPTTTQGDIIYHNGTDNIRLAKGIAGDVLTMNVGATAPEWAAPAPGGGGLSHAQVMARGVFGGPF